MIYVRDWVASIPDEDKHIAYVGEGKSEQKEFLLTGKGWETYKDWAFHLDMAFDPTSITTRDSRQVVQTTVNSSEQTDETGVTKDAVTTKETYIVDDVQVTNHNLTDIAPLTKQVTENGIHLTWNILRQHTVLPGKLWATLRAVEGTEQRIKKSAIMTFEVEAAICAVPSSVPSISEFEQMELSMDALCLQVEEAASRAQHDSAVAAIAAESVSANMQTVNTILQTVAGHAAQVESHHASVVAHALSVSQIAEETRENLTQAVVHADLAATSAQKAQAHCNTAQDAATNATEQASKSAAAAAEATAAASNAYNAAHTAGVNANEAKAIANAANSAASSALTTLNNNVLPRLDTLEAGGRGLNKTQVDAIYGLLKKAAYTEAVTAEHNAFLAAFADAPDAPDEPEDHVHSYNAVVTAPDCVKGGYTTYTCACGHSYVGNYTDALGHTSVVVVGKAPTCTEDGLTDGAKCSRCDEILTAQQTIPATGHTYDGPNDEKCNTCGHVRDISCEHEYAMEETAPTCTEKGKKVYTCTKCGDSYTETIPALGHNYQIGDVIEPDCVNGGYTEYYCSKCLHTYTDNETEPMGHSYNEGVVTKEAGYGVAGEITYTCTVCGHTYTEIIPALAVPTLKATYNPTHEDSYTVCFVHGDDDADVIRKYLKVTADGKTVTDYTLSNNDDGSIKVSYNGAYTTVDVERDTMTILEPTFAMGTTSTSPEGEYSGSNTTTYKRPYVKTHSWEKLIHARFITAKYGYKYTFTFNGTRSHIPGWKLTVGFVNTDLLDEVANRKTYSSSGLQSTGWQTLTGNTFTCTAPETINNKPVGAFRMVIQSTDARKLRDDGNVDFTSMTITATPVNT